MLLKLVIFYSIYLINFCMGNAEDELLQVHRTFLQELLNNRDELVRVKHELELKKQEEGKMIALKKELILLKSQLIGKMQQPTDQLVSDSTKDDMINEIKDIGAELIRYGLKKKGKILVILQAIKRFLLNRRKPKTPLLENIPST